MNKNKAIINKLLVLKLLVFIIIQVCVSNMVYAETIYYKLCKKIEGGKEYTNTGGGQFVTFENNLCYDSDVYGISVKNGNLNYLDVANGNLRYVGESYWGKAYYIVKPDKSVLNVWINDNLIYVYRRSTSPSDVYTCTLIKRQPSNNPTNYIEPINNSTTPNHYIPSNNSSKNTDEQPQQSNVVPNSNDLNRFKCAYCNGTGMIEKNDNAPATYGQNQPRQKCSTCGKWYDPGVFTHYHQQCRHCGGTGYTK